MITPVTGDMDFTIEEYRAAFAKAFEAYAKEGARMRDLLVTNGSNPARSTAIAEQQERLNIARSQYEQARCRYVEHVLRDFVTRKENT